MAGRIGAYTQKVDEDCRTPFHDATQVGFKTNIRQLINKWYSSVPKVWSIPYNWQRLWPTQHISAWTPMANSDETADITKLYEAVRLDSNLEQIRTVKIEPGREDDPIILTVERSALSKIKYTALSYMWGYKPLYFLPLDLRHRPRITVRCEGNSHEVSHKITPNLHAALRQLRSSEDSRTVFWIDAICINQKDGPEKTGQLKLMGKIYTLAERTIVWLGEETFTSARGFEAIDFLSHRMLNGLVFQHESHAQAQPLNLFSSLADHWRIISYTTALVWLLQNPYFSRIWIIQELVLSNNIEFRHGNKTVSMEYFEAAAATLLNIGPKSSTNLNTILAIRSLIQHHSRVDPKDLASRFRELVAERFDLDYGIFSLMLLFRRSHATEKVDKVFGLIGLSREWENFQPLGIDEECKPEEQDDYIQVYIRAAISILKAEQDLGLFTALSLQPDAGRMTMLPSWVPDWSDTQHLAVPIRARSCNVPATGDSKFEYDTENSHLSPGALILSGYEIGRINQIGRPCNTVRAQPSAWLCFRSCFTSAGSHRLQILTDWWAKFGAQASTSDEFDATVTCGLASNYRNASVTELATRFQKTGLSHLPLHYKLLGVFGPLVSCLKPTQTVFYLVTLPYLTHILANLLVHYVIFSIWPDLVFFRLSQKLDEQNLYDAALVHMEGRTIAKTNGGRLALVPEFALEGDIIAVFRGGRKPLVLRRVSSSDSFRIVGESYVYAIMTGVETYHEDRCQPFVIV